MSGDIYNSPVATSPLSQFPFPNQDNLRRGSLRRGSTASSISSNTPSIAESGPNAISTLLQPPIVRTGLRPADAGFKPPTQKDIPPVALTNITHVDNKAFHSYLSQVGSLYEAFQRAKNETDGSDAALFHRDKKEKSEDWETVLNKKLQRPAHSRTASTVSTPADVPPTIRRRSSGQRRQAVTPLSTIPSVYAEEDFHLENPRTFDIVSEHSEIIRDPTAAPSGRKSLATNAILQEKLSWYMDTVEVHLISSISTASKSFFSALGSLRELHDEAEESVARIQKLRKDLAKLDKDMAVDGLKVVKLKQRRDNVRQLAEAILQLEDIVNAVRKCEDMVENGEIDGAIDNIDDIEQLMRGKETPRYLETQREKRYEAQDLRKIRALEGALDDLNQLRFRAGRGYEGRFHNCLLGDMRRHVAETDTNTTLQRWGIAYTRIKPGQRRAPSTFPSYMNMPPEFRIELEKAMRGLTRARHTTSAVTSFRNLVLREMKTMIQKHLPSSGDDDTMSTISASTHGGRGRSIQEKSSIIARNLRALDFEDWYTLLSKIYTNVSESLRRLSVQVKILLDVTSTMDQSQLEGMRSPPKSPDPQNRTRSPARNRARSIQAEMQQALDLSSLLGDAVDAVQSRITRVVRIRSQQNAEMILQEFIRYVTLNRLFAEECEAISGRSGQGLKSVIDNQIRDYVSQWANGQQQRLLDIMDNDRWEPKDFGDTENKILTRIIDGSTSDAIVWAESAQIWQALTIGSINGQATNGGENGVKDKTRSAVIDEQRFILPESPIAAMRAVEAFQHLTVGIPGMGQELASNLLDCLRQYNSRTQQLVLGAGATRTAGLKSITTKHLALSSQGVSFIITLMPYIREFFRRYVSASNASQVLAEFDKVKRSLQEHQHSVHEKLVDMMTGRAAAHIKTMKTIDWDEAARTDSSGVSKYMEALTKETATFHRLLTKPLPEGAVLAIMGPVFSSYRRQWEDAFQAVDVHSESGKKRMLSDAEYFDAKLSKLEGAGDLGSHIVEVVRKKEVKTKDVSSAAAEKTEQNQLASEQDGGGANAKTDGSAPKS